MQDDEALEHYFTEQVVGQPFVVELGPNANVRREPAGALRLHMLAAQVELMGHAARGLMAPLNAELDGGQPVSVAALARARRRLLASALLVILCLWSVLLWWLLQRFGH